MTRVIDTTRTVTFEKDVYGPEVPGWFVVVFDPVQALTDNFIAGNGYSIWPVTYETKEAAEADYLNSMGN